MVVTHTALASWHSVRGKRHASPVQQRCQGQSAPGKSSCPRRGRQSPQPGGELPCMAGHRAHAALLEALPTPSPSRRAPSPPSEGHGGRTKRAAKPLGDPAQQSSLGRDGAFLFYNLNCSVVN